jgi:ribose transport system ATP-binding protein
MPIDNGTLLSMRSIRKAFPGVLALDDVRFDLHRGEVHALIGENGAGKSTLIKLLAGVYLKDQGQILLEGQPIDIESPHQAQRLGIYTVFQELSTVANLSIAENMFLGRELLKNGLIDRRRQVEETERLLASFNYCLDPRRIVEDLNVAELKMISIIKVLNNDVKILILDEPTASLTDRESGILFENIRKLRDRGAGVIYISHRMEELKHIGDRVTVLRNGQYIDTLKLQEVRSIDDLTPLMIGKELKSKFPKVPVNVGKPLLQVKGLTRQGHFYDIGLEVRAGEVLGFFGLVGCGFEEIFRSVFGAATYESGTVAMFDGSEFKPVLKDNPQSALDLKLGYIPRDRKNEGLIMPMSVKENIAISSLRKFSQNFFGLINRRKVGEEVKKYKELMDIRTPNLSTVVESLSGGNQQKVVIARTLCRGGQVFLFCEPTAGIDVGTKVEIYQFMNRLTSQGAGIVLVSYELPEIMGMSDRIIVVYQGRIVKEFQRAKASQDEILSYAFGSGDAALPVTDPHPCGEDN